MDKKTIFLNYDADQMGLDSIKAKEEYFVSQILREKYNVVISEKPDYVVVSGYELLYLNYRYITEDTILIQIQGEALAPNFTLFDYAIGYDNLSFHDRYLQWHLSHHYDIEYNENPGLSRDLSKRKFCSFLVGNPLADVRQTFFQSLSRYRQVSSGGIVNNNIGKVIPPGRKAKLQFLSEYKFHVAFENALYRGYTTEKIAEAFCAHTIPIYWGNPDVAEYYNPASFINCHDYASFDEVIEKIKEVDQNPELYMEMLRAIPAKKEIVERKHQELRNFLFHIFDQPLEKARRRGRGTTDSVSLKLYKNMQQFHKVYFPADNPWSRFEQLSKALQSYKTSSYTGADHFYRFRQRALKQKIWNRAKRFAKKLHLYTILRPVVKILRSAYVKFKARKEG